MSPRYLRNEPDRRENITAMLISGTLAVGVGIVAFYVARLLLAREPIARAGEADCQDLVRVES